MIYPEIDHERTEGRIKIIAFSLEERKDSITGDNRVIFIRSRINHMKIFAKWNTQVRLVPGGKCLGSLAFIKTPPIPVTLCINN